MLTERYDEVQVDEQRAAAAYRVTQTRLKYAQQARNASQRRLADLSAEEFESGGGFDSMTSMLGDANGPQGYLNEVGLGQVLAQQGTDTLAESQANDVVAKVFRNQAHDLLAAQQADLRAARDLKLAIQAAVARQDAFVRASRTKRNTLAHRAGHLASARGGAAGGQAGGPRGRGGGRRRAGRGRRRSHGRAQPGPLLGVGIRSERDPGRHRRQLGA